MAYTSTGLGCSCWFFLRDCFHRAVRTLFYFNESHLSGFLCIHLHEAGIVELLLFSELEVVRFYGMSSRTAQRSARNFSTLAAASSSSTGVPAHAIVDAATDMQDNQVHFKRQTLR
jgi:hypothetical protein